MGKEIEEVDVPADLKDQVIKYRGQLIEAIVENDEEMMTQYLEGNEPEIAELKKVLRKATIENKIVPILVGSALKNKGVQFLLDAIVEFLPSPIDVPPMEGTAVNDEEKIKLENLQMKSLYQLWLLRLRLTLMLGGFALPGYTQVF